MTINVRRIVTDHDANGKAIISSDKIMDNVQTLRSGNSNALLWVTDTAPAEIEGKEDPAYRSMDIEPPKTGTIFRMLELAPGKDAYMHRTNTIDYAICMSGKCKMELDDGQVIDMQAGDVMVQRATWHGWANPYQEPCQIIFILIGSKEPSKVLHPAAH
jgi:quercetin dioxygenase-like cupin family protein